MLNKIKKLREKNNILWSKLLGLTNEEIEKRKQNNTIMMNTLKKLIDTDKIRFKRIFKKILDNDLKINELGKELIK